MSDDQHLLRHMLAVIAYRGGNVLRNAPADFGATRIRDDTRSAVEILAHINDVLYWGLTKVQGDPVLNERPAGKWRQQLDDFYDLLARFDETLRSMDELPCSPARLLAGPLADTLTHIGQLATLRKLAGSPVRGESYFAADIETGRVGPDQAAPVKEKR
ncbi:MAG: hypothetical protein KJO43_15670 [Phycisphaerae bacterium]|nr:hypothetical protein [Phycisphaerae bacterium]NNF43925.1 hypothetical protein [Phycisphaerales bacterium]